MAAYLQHEKVLGSCNDASAARSYARRHTEDDRKIDPGPQPDFEDAERVLHDLGISCILFQQLQPFNGVFDRNEVCCR